MDELRDKSLKEFLTLQSRIASKTMENATVIDKIYFDAVSQLENECVFLKQQQIEDAEFKRRVEPLLAVYSKLSSGWAMFCYAGVVIFAIYEALQKIGVVK